MPTFFLNYETTCRTFSCVLAYFWSCYSVCRVLFSIMLRSWLARLHQKKNLLNLKCSSVEDKMQMLHKQLEASEKFKTEYQKLYEDAINYLNKVSGCYKSCITDLARICSSLDERHSCSLEMLDSAKQESLEWRRKYEKTWNKNKAVKDQVKVETVSGTHEEEARLTDAHGKRPMNGKRSMILQLMNSRLI